jgi:hypothetical protein
VDADEGGRMILAVWLGFLLGVVLGVSMVEAGEAGGVLAIPITIAGVATGLYILIRGLIAVFGA